MKSADRLALYVNGELVSQSPAFEADGYDLDSAAPLRIGTGTTGPLNGRLADIRIYGRALGIAEVEALAAAPPLP